MFLGRKAAGRSCKVPSSGFVTCRLRNIGQRLQQPVHQPASLQRLVALHAAAGGRAWRRRLVVSGRRGEEANRRRLGGGAAIDPGRRRIRCHRCRRGGKNPGRRSWPIAIAPHLALAVVRRLLHGYGRPERRGYEPPPTALGGPALALRPANDKPIDGARHRHIEEAPIFILRLSPRALARRAQWCSIGRLRGSPSEATGQVGHRGLKRQESGLALRRSRRRRRGVGKNDDRRFQALCTVHRHHPHLVAGDLHVALHVGLRGAQPGDEALQRRRLAPFVREREIEEFVQRIVGLVPEPGEETLAAAFGPQHARVKRKRHLPRPFAKALELGKRIGKARFGLRLRPQSRP